MKPIECIIFDLDGLLVRTEQLFFEAVKAALQEENLDVTLEQYVDSDVQAGIPIWDVVQGIESKTQRQRLVRRAYIIYAESLEEEKPNLFVEGAIPLIKDLSLVYKLAIASSSRQRFVNSLLKEAGVKDCFSAIVCREDVSNLKPHPACFLLVSEKLGIDSKQCVVIEDAQRGLDAAKAAGMLCIVVPNDLTNGSKFSDAAEVVEKLSDINRQLIAKIIERKSDT